MPFDPNQDFDSYITDKIKEINAANATSQTNTGAPGTPAVQSGPLSLNIAGQTFNYGNKEELEASLNAFMAKTGATLQELQTKVNQSQAAPVVDNRSVSGDDAPQWNDQAFIDKMSTSPKEGFEYAFNQLFFDGKSSDPMADMKRALHETELTKRSIAAYQFKENHPEFPGGQDAAKAIDNIREQMNLPYDYNGLEAAYLVGIQRGALPNFYAQHQQAQQTAQAAQAQNQNQGQVDPRAYNGGFGQNGQGTQAQQNNPYMAGPPTMGRQGYGNQFNPGVDYDNMPLEQLEQVIQRINQDMSRSR